MLRDTIVAFKSAGFAPLLSAVMTGALLVTGACSSNQQEVQPRTLRDLVGPASEYTARPTKTDLTADSLVRMGAQLEAEGEFNGAIRFYSQAVQMEPNHIGALTGIGNIYLAVGRWQAGLDTFQQVRALAPRSPRTAAGLATALLLNDRPVEARQILARQIEMTGPDLELQNLLGLASDLLGDHEAAQAAYSAALAIDPEDGELRTNLALSLALGGEYKRAEAVLNAGAGTPDAIPFAAQNLAVVHALAGEIGRAVEAAKRELPAAQAEENRPFYESLQILRGRERVRAVFFGTLPAGMEGTIETEPIPAPAISPPVETAPEPEIEVPSAPPVAPEPEPEETAPQKAEVSEPEVREPAAEPLQAPNPEETETAEPAEREPGQQEPAPASVERQEPEVPAEAPETAGPETREPAPEEPQTTTPEAIEPALKEPQSAAPEAIEPAAKEPQSAEPEPGVMMETEPETIAPQTVEPGAPEPQPAAPEALAPGPEESEITEPEPGEAAADELGPYWVQLGSYRTTDQLLAGWTTLTGRHADALSEFVPYGQRHDGGERGIYWRLLTGPAADRAIAQGDCELLLYAGLECFVIRTSENIGPLSDVTGE